MNRKALIIGNPGEPGDENYCRGVEKDLEFYPKYLTSPIGGIWFGSEITVLKRPTVQQVRSELPALASADYSFVMFSGHGCTERNSTKLELRRGQEIDSLELRQGATKRTLVLDCCREIRQSVVTEQRMLKALLAKADMDKSLSRKYFDDAVGQCPRGLVVMHACSVGELAGDDENAGGYYSSSLIQGADSWAESGVSSYGRTTPYSKLSVVQAHETAYNRVRALSGGTQNPHIEKARSDPYFPFGIAM